jgi:hypothetical protein
MHCTIEDLVALRDGEGSVWARRHVEVCAECQAERERLYQRVAQLKALPALRPPRDDVRAPTTLSAASDSESAEMIGRLLSLRMRRPSSTLVPASRTTSGI